MQLLFKLVNAAIPIPFMLFTGATAISNGSLILMKQSLGLVADKINKHIEGVVLPDGLPFIELSDLSQSLADIFKLPFPLLNTLLELVD